MATYSKQLLGNSTNGRAIKLIATTDPGNTIHTAVSGTSNFDEIYLFVSNINATNAINLTVQWGSNTSPDDYICNAVSIPAASPPIPIVTGLVLNNGALVKAFGSTASQLLISGYVNRITV